MVHSIAPLACILFWLGTEVLYCGVCLSRLERLGWDPAFSVPSCYHRWVFEPGFLCSVRSLSLGLESSEPVYKGLTVTLGVWLQVLPQGQTVVEKREIAAKWPCIGSNHATRRECAKGGVLQGLLGKASTGSRGAMTALLPILGNAAHPCFRQSWPGLLCGGRWFWRSSVCATEKICLWKCASMCVCVCVWGMCLCVCMYTCMTENVRIYYKAVETFKNNFLCF